MNKTDARALLARLTCTNLICVETRTGIAWSMTLCFDGKPMLKASNSGRGGSTDYWGVRNVEGARRTERLLTEAARVAGAGDFEPLDAVAGALEPGMNGAQALDAAIVYQAEYDAMYGGAR